MSPECDYMSEGPHLETELVFKCGRSSDVVFEGACAPVLCFISRRVTRQAVLHGSYDLHIASPNLELYLQNKSFFLLPMPGPRSEAPRRLHDPFKVPVQSMKASTISISEHNASRPPGNSSTDSHVASGGILYRCRKRTSRRDAMFNRIAGLRAVIV